MKISELKMKLKANGCYFVNEGKNHEWWYSPITNIKFQLPRHMKADVGIVLLNYIKKQSGVNFK